MSRELQRAVISKTWVGKFVSSALWSSGWVVARLRPKSSGDSFLPSSSAPASGPFGSRKVGW